MKFISDTKKTWSFVVFIVILMMDSTSWIDTGLFELSILLLISFDVFFFKEICPFHYVVKYKDLKVVHISLLSF